RHEAFAAELGPRLSRGASIYLEGDEGFKEQTIRWQLFAPPSFHVAVVVGDERDVQLTVASANEFGLPWLAISGHHGGIRSMEKLKHGVQISLSELNEISIASDGNTAYIGGGTLSKSATDALWALGKQTVTGTCECTSLAGPMLGGGRGLLEGKYGLMIDQLVEARIVLADGSLVTANAEEYPDLFWALRGAGHNFGIVTQVRYKVYDVPKDNQWVVGFFTFTEDKLEKIFALTNELTKDGLQPAEFLNFIFAMRTLINGTSMTVMNVAILYEGSLSDSNQYMDQYAALGPANTIIMPSSYPILPSMLAAGINDVACLKNTYSSLRFPVSWPSYNLPTVRRLYTKFDQLTANAAFNASVYFFEGYSVRGVQAVAPESTAFPDRANIILTALFLTYFDSRLDEEAVRLGKEMREIALGGVADGRLDAYVNYAHGDEGVEAWYGHETWRIDKLRALKEKYDPHNRFAFYAPIVEYGQ
ncbi:FAD binding domain protein, partial [Mycena metata]